MSHFYISLLPSIVPLVDHGDLMTLQGHRNILFNSQTNNNPTKHVHHLLRLTALCKSAFTWINTLQCTCLVLCRRTFRLCGASYSPGGGAKATVWRNLLSTIQFYLKTRSHCSYNFAIQKRSSPQTSLKIFSVTWLPLSENVGFSVFLQMNALNICARVVSGLERERPLKKQQQQKPWLTWLSMFVSICWICFFIRAHINEGNQSSKVLLQSG